MVTVTEAVISMAHTPESQFTASVSKSVLLNDLHQNKTQKCLSVVMAERCRFDDDDSHPPHFFTRGAERRHLLCRWTMVLSCCTSNQFSFKVLYECGCAK